MSNRRDHLVIEQVLWKENEKMIVDYLTYTFTEEHEDNLPDLAKAINPGAVALETRTGYVHG